MAKGFLSIILHAHLPYVRHPEYEHFFEENWLFEAITECYVPLIAMLDRLAADHIDYHLTLSLSPPLITLLSDELLQARYLQYLQRLQELAHKEVLRTRQEQPEFKTLARLYRNFFRKTLQIYQQQYACDLVAAFKKHQATGHLELITCAATHGFLPLLNVSEIAVRNQIKIGVDVFKEHFGLQPNGFWLPECGYYQGLENILKHEGIRYFFVDAHGLLCANDPPRHGVYAPLDCANGVMAFARELKLSQQVWSSKEGYPGDFDYREYYRDIGFDLDLDYIAPYILNGSTRINTGIKYFRVTGHDAHKELYQPKQALLKAKIHAADFIAKCQQQVAQQTLLDEHPPMIVTPFDAELFGHWWFEGPHWLESVLRLAAQPNETLQLASPADYLTLYPTHQVTQPSASTWGDQGYSSYWINETNAWIYPLLHKAETQLEQLVADLSKFTLSDLQVRALNQAARSVLLAQASDWPFIMQSGTTVEYANQRIIDHLARFNYLYDSVRKGKIDERYLAALEIMDNIFPAIDFRDYMKTGK